MRFVISTQECELLLYFEQAENLLDLAMQLNKDVSVISRKLKDIATKTDLLEKQQGRWVLSEKGKALNVWTREAIYSQRLVLEKQKSIRLATTREFANRVLLPNAKKLVEGQDISVAILSTDAGIEKYILAGQADFGFDCGRPESPSIAFKRLLPEPFVTVAAPSFIKKHGIVNFLDLKNKDHLKFLRSEGAVWDIDVDAGHFFGIFNDMANLREACILGFGWTVIPYYMVKKELALGQVIEIKGFDFPEQKIGVWWLRDRVNILPWIDRACAWLLEQNLG